MSVRVLHRIQHLPKQFKTLANREAAVIAVCRERRAVDAIQGKVEAWKA
jgi:hypothetical protein